MKKIVLLGCHPLRKVMLIHAYYHHKLEVKAILALVCQMQHVAMFKEYQNFTAL